MANIQASIRAVNPKNLTLLKENARFMTHEQFHRLVENIKRDGCLTSTPLVWEEQSSDGVKTGNLIVLSGNHRTKAAIAVGLVSINVMILEQFLDEEKRIAIQLAHNAITGQDDPATLKNLYEKLNIELRSYSGIDDKMLDLLAQVKPVSIGEANLTFQTICLIFLPDEIEEAKKSFESAKKIMKADQYWISKFSTYDDWLDSLELAGSSYNVKNVATCLKIILNIFNSHKDELKKGWENKKNGDVYLSTILEEKIPVSAAKAIGKALDKAEGKGEITTETRWKLIEKLCNEYTTADQ